MVRRLAPEIGDSSLSPSWAARDEGSRLWHYRVCHSVIGTGNGTRTDGKKGRRNPRTRRRKNEKPKTAPPKPKATDEAYYLRWNPTGDYDSDDDDWWREVMALERENHRNDKKKKKKAAAEEQRAEEAALYLQYKHHTTKVMEWGNLSWAERYGDYYGESDGSESHLTLRAMIERLNDLAFDGVAMPADVHTNLEHAIELREEFQIRVVLERRSKISKTRRKKRNATKPSAAAAISPPLRNTSNEAGTVDGIDVDKMNDPSAPKIIQNDSTKDSNKYDTHLWILNQLKALLYRFRTEPEPKNIVSDNSCDDDCGIVLETKTSLDAENSSDESNPKSLSESCTIEQCPIDDNSHRSTTDQNCNESPCLTPVKEYDVATTIESSCASLSSTSVPSPVTDKDRCTDQSSASSSLVEDWDKIFGDNGSLIESNEDRDHCPKAQDLEIAMPHVAHNPQDDSSQNLSTSEILNRDANFRNDNTESCPKPKMLSSTSVPSPVTDKDRCTDQSSASSSSVEDWDEIFGDDGSLIESNKDSDICPKAQDLEITIPHVTHDLQDDSSKNLSTSEILNRDANFGNDNTKSCPKPKMSQIAISSDVFTLSKNVTELSNSSNNFVRRNFPPRNHNEGSTHTNKRKGILLEAKNISDELDQQMPPGQMITSSANGAMTLERPSASKNGTMPTSDGTIPERVQHPKLQYGSVWEMSFLEEEEDIVPANAVGTPAPTDRVLLQNSNPPEDWEMLLEDEDEEEDTQIESQVTSATEEQELESELGPNALGAKNSTIPTTDGKIPEQVQHPKQQYDSVWDISFLEEEKAMRSPLPSVKAPSQNSNPPEDWEMRSEEEDDVDDDDDEEDAQIKDPGIEESASRVASQVEEQEFKSDALPNVMGAKNGSIPTTDGIISERVQHPKQYGSVWDMSFLEEEESIRSHEPTVMILLQNSNPPEDWELLLDEEEDDEDAQIEDPVIEEAISRVASATEKQELKSDTIPNVLGAHNIELSPSAKDATESDHPNKAVRQDVSKLTKPPYTMTENLRYDSVWDVFSKEKISGGTRAADNDSTTGSTITRSTISITQNAPPEDDWEALYS